MGQLMFLQAVTAFAPEVLNDLTDLGADFSRETPRLPPEALERLRKQGWAWVKRVEASDPMMTLVDLRDRLVRWAETWNVNEDWVLETALRTVASPLPSGPGKWRLPSIGLYVPSLHPPTGLPEYDPSSQHLGNYLDEVRDLSRESLESARLNGAVGDAQRLYEEEIISEVVKTARSYAHQVELCMVQAGGGRQKGLPERHFNWLVRHRVRRETSESIARHEALAGQAVTVAAVGKAVRELQDRIGLRPIRRTPGRPPQQKKK